MMRYSRSSSRAGRYRFKRLTAETLEGRLMLAGDLEIRISEVLANNATSLETRIRSEAGARFRGPKLTPDWIEIQNLTDQEFDLSGYHLTDSRDIPTKWQFNAGISVPANGYFVLYASGHDIRNADLDESGKLHTNFQLSSKGGDYLAITAPDGTLIHELAASLPRQFVDISFGIDSNEGTGYFVSSTPEESNSSLFDGIVADTRFSVDRGFYDQPFPVTLATETSGTEIRFTTDGSQPTANHGLIYSGPIEISTTTNLRAAAFLDGYIPTNVDTHTYVFLDDVIHQPAEIEGFPFGGRVWAGSNTYVPQDTQMDPEIVDNPSYSNVIHDALRAIPTMSISSDPEQIFGNNGWYDGENVEESVSVEVIYPDQPNRSHQADAGIESHSHDRLKRSLRLNFRAVYGHPAFNTDLFQTGPLHGDSAVDQVKRIILRGGNNRSWARIWNPDKTAYTIDEFYRSTQIAMSGYGLRGNYVHLYINGVYWGLYNPVERADEFFTAAYFGGNSIDWFAVNHGGDLEGNDDRYDYLWRTLARADLTQDENYEEFQQHLDIDGFADYLIISWWMAVSDWPGNNWYGGNRNDTSELGPTPFQYFAWDGEWSFGQGGDSSRNGKAHVHQAFRSSRRGGDAITRIWHAARTNDDFMTRFSDRVYKHLFHDGVLTEENAKARWMTLNNYVRDAVVAESARWGDAMESAGHPTRTRDLDWQREVNRVNRLMTGNKEVFIDALRREGFYPNVDPPTWNQHGGKVARGFELSMINPNESGTIYMTTNGTDPRHSGGAVSDDAMIVEPNATFSMENDRLIRARIYDGNEWSALREAAFVVHPESAIRITEIMYNPPAPTQTEIDAGFLDNDDFEFLELTNTGETTVALKDHRFDQGIEFTFPEMQLAPHEHVIVAKNTTAFQSRYGDTAIVAGQFTRGSLNNGGEGIRLLDSLGQVAIDLDYQDMAPWPLRADGIGASLELLAPENVPINQVSKYYRWKASSEFGGTPGTRASEQIGVVIHEVLTNTDGAAQSDSIELWNTSSEIVDLSGWYLSDSSNDLFKFQIPDGTTLAPNQFLVFDESDFNIFDDPNRFALSGSRGDDVWLVMSTGGNQVPTFVDDVHFEGSRWAESLGRIGQWMVPQKSISLGTENSDPRIGPVVVSEIQYAPGNPSLQALAIDSQLTAGDLEFVEIYNSTASDINLTNWNLAGGIEFKFDDSVVLPGQSSIVVTPFNPASPENENRLRAFRAHYAIDQDQLLVGGYRGRLSDEGDVVQLRRPELPPDDQPDLVPQILEDFVVYDNLDPWPDVVVGGEPRSIHRTTANAFGNSANSWTSGIPTPGTTDLIPDGDVDQNGVVDAQDIDLLCSQVNAGTHDAAFDLTNDALVTESDVARLVQEILGTAPGDSNLDGIFNSSDLVNIFITGEFEDSMENNSGWADGDWNCDAEFTTGDLVVAFQFGAFSRTATAAWDSPETILDSIFESNLSASLELIHDGFEFGLGRNPYQSLETMHQATTRSYDVAMRELKQRRIQFEFAPQLDESRDSLRRTSKRMAKPSETTELPEQLP